MTTTLRRHARRGITCAVAALGIGMVGGLSALSGPAGAETLAYTATATSGSIVLNEGSSNQQTISNPAVEFSGTFDDVAGTVSGTTSFDRAYTSSFAGPFALTLYAAADLTQRSPLSGSYDPDTGAVAATTEQRLLITVYNQAGASQAPATDGKLTNQAGSTCFVDLELRFSGSFDADTGALSIADTQFTVPQFPAAPAGNPSGGCGLATTELNTRIAGPANSVALVFAGEVTTTTAPASTTTLPIGNPTTTSTSLPIGNPTTTSTSLPIGNPTTTTVQGGTTSTPAAGTCNPNYDPCVAVVQGDDVDCSELTARDIRVVGTDVYGLDRDADGIACEDDDAGTTDGDLARTGADTRTPLAVGGALLSLGLVLVGLSRRRAARMI